MSSQGKGKARRIFFSMFFQESPQNDDILPLSHRRSSTKKLKRTKRFKSQGTVVSNPTGYFTKSEPKARSSWFSCVSKKFKSTSNIL